MKIKIDLTAREREILAKIAAGATNDQIARSLDLNVGTVRIHINLIYRVLGVNNRLQAALWAVKNRDLIEAVDRRAGIYRGLHSKFSKPEESRTAV